MLQLVAHAVEGCIGFGLPGVPQAVVHSTHRLTERGVCGAEGVREEFVIPTTDYGLWWGTNSDSTDSRSGFFCFCVHSLHV